MKPFIKMTVVVFFSVVISSMILIQRASRIRTSSSEQPPRAERLLSIEERRSISTNFAAIPLHFELNQGQTDSSVRFISRSGNHALLLKQNETELALPNMDKTLSGIPKLGQPDLLRMSLARANENPAVAGLDELPGRTNYFIGNNPDDWQKDVRTFEKVKYSSVYEGVDLIYYGNQQKLEYDFIVAPNTNPNVIALKFDNARDIKLDANGDMILSVGKHEVRQHAPIVYQEMNGNREEVQASYVIRENGSQGEREIGFAIDSYDHSKPLIIDPVIVFSTFLGGSSGDDLFTIESGFGITVDSTGNVYVAGVTPSGDFPMQSPQQPGGAGNYDGFITKFNPTGSALLFSTYFGGMDEDRIFSISLGPANEVFVSGYTLSSNFPTMTPFQAINNGQYDGFISRFTSSGVLTYSTYIGGAGGDTCMFIKNEGANIVTFAGSTGSTDFPTANAVQPNSAGFSDFVVGKLNIATNTLIFSTYFGGTGNDNMNLSSGAVDPAGNVYIGGVSGSFDYPVTPNAFQIENGGSDDVVITKLSATGNTVIYSTYLGGNLVDSADALTADSNGNAYVTGFTRSANYPLKNAAQPHLNDPDAFVTKVNPSGTDLVYSTFLGGSNLERGSGIAADAAGNCYVTGRSNSGDFPMKRALRPPRGLDDVFVCRFNRDGALLFSTLIGGGSNDNGFGIAADGNNNAYITGRAARAFFTTPGVFQPILGGNGDAFVTKMNTSVRKVKSDFDGDGKTDVAVFRPSNGVWYLLRSTLGFTAFQFGTNGDVPVPGDYDGDAKTDIAVFRPSEGTWFILNSKTNTVRSLFWGISTDKAIPGDYDGDDKTDVAVYRPSSGVWFIILSSNNSLRTNIFGLAGDKPVPADFDGDSVTDIAVYSPANGLWSIVGSFSGVITQQFGIATDKLVPADYDGDAYDDISVYRPAPGIWYSLRSGSNNSLSAFQWGSSTDVPSAGDYDGDGKEDIAVFRPTDGNWYVNRSSNGSTFSVQFGMNGDIPIASAYVPQ